MRGKDGAAVKKEIKKRITPAYAGKSSRSQNSRLERRDHPRLCGEKGNDWICEKPLIGSPPPMRGKAAKSFETDIICRITPAYAGKSFTMHITHLYG